MKKLFLYASMIALMVSCVNDDYDLQNLDTEMTFFGEEGIEFPVSGADDSEVDLLSSENLDNIQSEMVEEASSTVQNVSLDNVSEEKIDSGIEVNGKFSFNLKNVPEIYRNPDCSFKFDGQSCFTIDIDNECSGEFLLSCDIRDAVKNKLIGHLDNIQVSRGKGQAVRLRFNECGLDNLPDVAEITNIVLKRASTKAGSTVSGTVSFGGATFGLSSKILKDSCLKLKQEYSDIYKELDIDLSELGDRVSSSAFIVNGLIISDLPITFTASLKGDLTASVTFTSPTPTSGTSLSIPFTCTQNMLSAKQATLEATILATGDIDLSKLDSYRLSTSIESVRFNEGITVNL